VPPAILANPELEWRQLDDSSVEVTTRTLGKPLSVWLQFDDAGEIVQTAAERPRIVAGGAITRWIGTYRDYAELGGMRVPTRGEVRWELPEGPFTYWRGTVNAVFPRA
jgi:hypothetical protein